MNPFWIAGLGLLFSATAYFLGPRLDLDDIQHAATVARDTLSIPFVIIGIHWFSVLLACGLIIEIPCWVRQRWNSMRESISAILNWVTGLPLRIANSLPFITRNRIRIYGATSFVYFIGASYLCNIVLRLFNKTWVLWKLVQFCYIMGFCFEEVCSWVTAECRIESVLRARTFLTRIHLPSVIILFLSPDIWNSLSLHFIIPSFVSLLIQYRILNTYNPRRLETHSNGDAPRIYENLEERAFALNSMRFFLRQFHDRDPQLPALPPDPLQAPEVVPLGAPELAPLGAGEVVAPLGAGEVVAPLGAVEAVAPLAAAEAVAPGEGVAPLGAGEAVAPLGAGEAVAPLGTGEAVAPLAAAEAVAPLAAAEAVDPLRAAEPAPPRPPESKNEDNE